MLPKGHKADLSSVKFVQNRYVIVTLATKVIFFDIEVEKDELETVEIEDSEESLALIQPVQTITLSEAEKTYDSICGVITDPEDLSQSWLFLTSSNYSKIHMVRVGDYLWQ